VLEYVVIDVLISSHKTKDFAVAMTIKKLSVEDLFSDSGPFDEAEVVEVLKPFVTIQKSTNEIFIKDHSLTAEHRILIFGLAKKLLKAKGLIESELISASEVHQKTGIKKGTIDPTFKKLKESGFLVGKGEYEIPTPKVPDLLRILRERHK